MSPTNRHRGTLTGLIVLGAAAFNTTGALASASENSLGVSYVKADLSQPASAESLYKRIQFAARTVCHEPNPHELSRFANYRLCVEKAVDAAVTQVDATALTALHRSKTQRSAAS
ncbi:MAG TPA: UrcA family protein [Steroidobacteraceae bacterium]|nr:UrcA family protein [Steroidobacteraceae bacterium]